MKELVLFLARGLVEHPDQVEASVAEEGDTLRVTLRVAEEDKGKIIGKQGKVIKALRTLAAARAAKDGRQALLDLE